MFQVACRTTLEQMPSVLQLPGLQILVNTGVVRRKISLSLISQLCIFDLVDHHSRIYPSVSGSESAGAYYRVSEEEVVFKLLCQADKVGSLIGKGGSSVRAIQNDTGASIKIADPVPDSDERVVVIYAREACESVCSSLYSCYFLCGELQFFVLLYLGAFGYCSYLQNVNLFSSRLSISGHNQEPKLSNCIWTSHVINTYIISS